MMNMLSLSFSITFICVLLSVRIILMHGSPITSCSQTPYPEVCNHYFNKNNVFTTLENTDSTFHNLALKVTMNQALHAHNLVSTMNITSLNNRAKMAWNDCVELYEDTVHMLNHSLISSNHDDSQTWLSASLANKETCQNGFMEFNMSSHLDSFPLMLSNFSKLISNSLALNGAAASLSPLHDHTQKVGARRRLLGNNRFPGWISDANRRLLQPFWDATRADIVVAQDGSGNYKTITEAVVVAAKHKGAKRIVIHVKKGVYKENVEIKRLMKNLMLIGDGIGATVVTGNRNVLDGWTTFRSATFAVSGQGFIARDITFENTAGPQNHQAVAVQSSSDFSIFYRCSFKGYQDTLYVHSKRQFYRDCDIYGTIDFIFGDAAAIFQNCNIYVRKPMTNQKTTVTAQARTDPNESTGIVIQNSQVTASPEMRPVTGMFKSYLGRPWKMYSRTIFIKCAIDGLIDRVGWLEWNGNFGLSSLYYGEYMNTGIGASTQGRVKWPGFHVISSAKEAAKFTLGNFLPGYSWLLAAKVPFTSGL